MLRGEHRHRMSFFQSHIQSIMISYSLCFQTMKKDQRIQSALYARIEILTKMQTRRPDSKPS